MVITKVEKDKTPISRKKFLTLSLIIVLVFLLASLSYYFFFTTRGSSTITKFLVSRFLGPKEINIQETKGSLSERMSFSDVKMENLQGLPQGSIIEIQKVDVFFTSFTADGLNVELENARLRLPAQAPLLFYGSYRNSNLDFNIYFKELNVREILDLFGQERLFKNVAGLVEDLDVYLKGPLSNPQLSGTFLIKGLNRGAFSMNGCDVGFDVVVKDMGEDPKLFGEVELKNGVVTRAKAAEIRLQKSKILFSGNPKSPALDLKGTSAVEGTKIEIALKGTMDKPDLQLSSEPPLSPERLLVMLATGKSWQGAQDAIVQGRISKDLAVDFLDYFVLSGSGNKLAQRLGISDVLLKYDEGVKGIGFKKNISEKVQASYEIEQSQEKDGPASITQKVGGEYKVTESISVGAQKELKQDEADIQQKPQADDKVFLKYKKKF